MGLGIQKDGEEVVHARWSGGAEGWVAWSQSPSGYLLGVEHMDILSYLGLRDRLTCTLAMYRVPLAIKLSWRSSPCSHCPSFFHWTLGWGFPVTLHGSHTAEPSASV